MPARKPDTSAALLPVDHTNLYFPFPPFGNTLAVPAEPAHCGSLMLISARKSVLLCANTDTALKLMPMNKASKQQKKCADKTAWLRLNEATAKRNKTVEFIMRVNYNGAYICKKI